MGAVGSGKQVRAAAEYSNRDRDADDVENDDPRMGMGGGVYPVIVGSLMIFIAVIFIITST